jgi:hypothetical protein
MTTNNQLIKFSTLWSRHKTYTLRNNLDGQNSRKSLSWLWMAAQANPPAVSCPFAQYLAMIWWHEGDATMQRQSH